MLDDPAKKNEMMLEDLVKKNDALTARIKSLISENNALRSKAATLSRLALTGKEEDGAPVWGAVLASPGSRYVLRQVISMGSGTTGVMFYGPYRSLPAGQYELKLELNAQPAQGELSDIIGVLEVVYQDIFLVRELIRRSADTEYIVRFRIETDVGAILSEDRYEFRLISAGAHDLEAFDLVLSICDAKEERHRNQIFLTDIAQFPAETPPRNSAFDPITAAVDFNGHIIYGPYARVAPGRYRLDIDLSVEPAANSKPQPVTVDVISENRASLARRDFAATPGRRTVSLDFVVPVARDLDAIMKSLEFRLEKQPGIAIEVLDIRCKSSVD